MELGITGFLPSREWSLSYGAVPTTMPGLTRHPLDSCFRRNGIEYCRIPAFAGMELGITGFLPSREWSLSYGAVPTTMPGLTRHPLDSCFRRNGIEYCRIPAFAGWYWVLPDFLPSREWSLSYGAVPTTMPGLTRHPLDSCFRRNGIEYCRIPAFAGMVLGYRIPAFAGMVGIPTTMPGLSMDSASAVALHHAGLDPAFLLRIGFCFRRNGIGYYRIPAFAGMVLGAA